MTTSEVKTAENFIALRVEKGFTEVGWGSKRRLLELEDESEKGKRE